MTEAEVAMLLISMIGKKVRLKFINGQVLPTEVVIESVKDTVFVANGTIWLIILIYDVQIVREE